MKGCVLAGRFVFSDPAKNTARALREKGEPPTEGPKSRNG
jgi:hypothetical protein